MFPPSIEQLLGVASSVSHYRAVLTRDAIAIEATGPEDHARAMEFAREAMKEGWGDRIHARPTPVMMSGGLPVPMAYPATLPIPVAPAPAPVPGHHVDAGLPDKAAMESPPAPIESPTDLPEER